MNEFLNHVISILCERVAGIQAIALRGSQQNSPLVDMWSDYDLLIVLNQSRSIDKNEFLEAVNTLGLVVGSGLQSRENSILCRIAVQFQSAIQLLDLVREYLVLQMVERDRIHKTNIHRFGGNEYLPDTIKLSQIDECDQEKILDYIARLAYEYDKQLASMVDNYIGRYPLVEDYIERSKERLLGR